MEQSTSCPNVLAGQGVESPDPVRVAALERMFAFVMAPLIRTIVALLMMSDRRQ